MNYWLFKSEPTCFSIDELLSKPNQTTHWDGVRNYQARNFMRDGMKKGDGGIFYHSSCAVPHAAGTVTIVKEGYPDFTAWDVASDHFDAGSTAENPRWFMVDIQAQQKFDREISITEMKQFVELAGMQLLKIGNRLSVMPLSAAEYGFICRLGGITSN